MDLKSQLIRFECIVPHAYQDHLGFWTIGCGRLIDKRKGGGLSEAEIDLLLTNDIRDKTIDVMRALPWAATLTEPRQAVLIGMAFQMGIGGLLTFKNTLADMQAGRYEDASLGMLRSDWAKQTPERAECLAEQMKTGQWQIPD